MKVYIVTMLPLAVAGDVPGVEQHKNTARKAKLHSPILHGKWQPTY